jgi:hypothetical protein
VEVEYVSQTGGDSLLVQQQQKQTQCFDIVLQFALRNTTRLFIHTVTIG